MEEQDCYVSSSCGTNKATATRDMPDNVDCCWAKQRRTDVSRGRQQQQWRRRTRNGCCQNPTFNEDIKMLVLPGSRVMDRLSHEMAARRDRQVRLHSVQTDLELDLPPNIALPDGEEVPYGSSTRLQIRDNEQESEIYQKCIRPPPNRTVFDGESPPSYRSSSAGVLGSGDSGDLSGGCSGTTRVMRCHSVSSGSSSSGSPMSTTTTDVFVPPCLNDMSTFSDSRVGGNVVDLEKLPVVLCHQPEEYGRRKPPTPQRGAV